MPGKAKEGRRLNGSVIQAIERNPKARAGFKVLIKSDAVLTTLELPLTKAGAPCAN